MRERDQGPGWPGALLAALALVVAVAGCGGGSDPEPEPLAAGIAFAQDVGSVEPESAPGVSIDALLLKTERRVSRSVVEYEFEVRLRNDGAALDAVTVQLVGAGNGATIVDDAVSAGAIAAGALVTPADTITIRQDRTRPFDPTSLQWRVGAALPPGSAVAAIVFDNGVPPAARAAITQVNTFVDGAPATGAVDVPLAAGSSDTLALALNATDEIVLASVELAPDGTLALSADSTALALVRIVFGPEPEDISVAQLNSAIRGAAGYAALVGAVDAALAANTAPSASPDVLQKVAQVLPQAIANLKNSGGTSQSAGGTRRRQALPGTVAALPLPYSLLATTGNTRSVHLTGSAVDTVQLVNSLPIYWDASANGATASLPPSTLTSVALGLVSPWLGPSPVSLPDAGGPAFTVRLRQSEGSRKENLSNITRAILGMAFDRMNTRGSIDIACQNALVSVVLASDVHDQLARAVSFDAFLAYLRDTARISALDWSGTFRKCFPTHPGRWGLFVGRYVVSISKYLGPIMLVADAIGLGYQMKVMSTHWSTDREIGVCQTDGILFGRNIANCAARFDIAPKPPALIPGAKATPSYRAFDDNDQETGLPSAISFSASNPAVFTVAPDTGEITATGAGNGMVTLAEAAIPAISSIAVQVVDGSVSPDKPKVEVGQTVRLKLVDAQGGDVVTSGSGLTWDSLNKPVAVVTPLSLAWPSPQQIDVQGVAPGKATIYAYNPVSGATRATDVEVVPPAPTRFRGSVSISGPAAMPSYGCSGTMTVSGTLTIDIGAIPTLTFDGNEIFMISCWQATIPSQASFSLTVDGSSASGSISSPFTCGPPCNNGLSTWSVNVERVNNNGVYSLVGTFSHGNQNQTPLNANATGNISLPVQP